MSSSWWAKGLLFENCNCAVICPGHVHFSQGCTHDNCIGYWLIRVDEGEIDGVDLAGAVAVVTYDSPKVMIEGGWRQVILLDRDCSPEKREKFESILKGERGGPWAVLARFVSERLPTMTVGISLRDEGRTKGVHIDGIMDATIEAIKGRDRDEPVTLRNMFNQIHSPTQVIARGSTDFTVPGFKFSNRESHGLYSEFYWKV